MSVIEDHGAVTSIAVLSLPVFRVPVQINGP